MNDLPPSDPNCGGGHDDHPSQAAALDGSDGSWLVEVLRSSTEGYGTADVSASGVDRSQLRRNLMLTPTERLEQMVAFVRFTLPLQGALRRKRD